ncbi:hypothetical protein O181_030960 [Austropuccinia psidii MF-1]|uniref:alpha-1,2-Mannosidase n=1 Tax=Austropuccinia psidii MF-1 TaxID=1389203 RepID=A0A9Q3H6Q9_9BASI|nr:hypothetical protein [Austropuccinia psidii MF-1]
MSAGSRSKQSMKSVTLIQAFFLCTGTLIFYALLCILLSYSILDLISPHPQVNGPRQSRGSTRRQNGGVAENMIQSPISGGPFVPQVGGLLIPDFERPWNTSSQSGARISKLLSKKRFPLIFYGNGSSGLVGMSAPPAPHWPPPRNIRGLPKSLQSPISIGQLDRVVQVQKKGASSTHYGSPDGPAFNSSSLPPIQWTDFKEKGDWDSDLLRTKNLRRREWVVRAFSHAWEGYKKKAWGYDQASPFSGLGENTFAGWGATIVDNLDTLLIMNMTQEYNYARTHIRELSWSSVISPYSFERLDGSSLNESYPTVNVLESVVRYMGALLSAYDLSGDDLMLIKADELAQWLLPAFNTKTGVPISNYHLGSNPHGSDTGELYLSEAGGLLLEFTRLAQLTGKAQYFDVVKQAFDFLRSSNLNSTSRIGTLLPQKINPDKPNELQGFYNLKAKSSIYYESLVKAIMLLGGNLTELQETVLSSIESVFQYLVQEVQLGGEGPKLSIVGEAYSFSERISYASKISQQSCSSAATLGLASKLLNKTEQLNFSLKHTDTCLWVHEASPSGLGPDELILKNYGSSFQTIPINEMSDARHRNRPETIESVFYMWRMTGDREWQDRGWKLFTTWAEASITKYGFAEIRDITQDLNDNYNKADFRNGALLGENFKYFYLLFSEPNFMSLDDCVFNVASHPLKIPGRNPSTQLNWTDPQDDAVSFLNPPGENLMAIHTARSTPQGFISSGTYLQQSSRISRQESLSE